MMACRFRGAPRCLRIAGPREKSRTSFVWPCRSSATDGELNAPRSMRLSLPIYEVVDARRRPRVLDSMKAVQRDLDRVEVPALRRVFPGFGGTLHHRFRSYHGRHATRRL